MQIGVDITAQGQGCFNSLQKLLIRLTLVYYCFFFKAIASRGNVHEFIGHLLSNRLKFVSNKGTFIAHMKVWTELP